MGIDQTVIDEIVRRVMSVVTAERIILFGSAATGQMTKDSDIDLLVLQKEPNDQDQRQFIHDALSGWGYAFDIISISTDWFEASKDMIGGIAYPANKYGTVIFRNDSRLAPGIPVSADEVLKKLVRQWTEKADKDVKAAEDLLTCGVPLTSHVCFHSNQAVEKYLKAFLTLRQVEFPKTHSIQELLDLVARADVELADELGPAITLMPYGDAILQPGDAPTPTEDEARAVLLLAERTVTEIALRIKMGVESNG